VVISLAHPTGEINECSLTAGGFSKKNEEEVKGWRRRRTCGHCDNSSITTKGRRSCMTKGDLGTNMESTQTEALS